MDSVDAHVEPRQLPACAEPTALAVVASVERIRRKVLVHLRGALDHGLLALGDCGKDDFLLLPELGCH